MGIDWITKIKIFNDDTLEGLEDEVNKFIKNRVIKGIQFIIGKSSFYIVVLYQEREGGN